MKTQKLIKLIFLMAAGLIFIFSVGCKEGPAGATGPAGADGIDGANGTNGTDGTDGVVISAADSAAYDSADAVNGGYLYDDLTKSAIGKASFDTAVTNNKDFFRCKACHGWDLIGTVGAYIGRDHKPYSGGRPHVAPNNLRAYVGSHNIKEVFNAVKHVGGRTHAKTGKVASLNDVMPDYSVFLTDGEVWDITKFLMDLALNTDDLYDLRTTGVYPTGSFEMRNIGKDGSATNGATYYSSNCASCHGADGSTIAIETKYYIGDFCRTKAYEIQHKVLVGQPGVTGMGPFTGVTLQNVKDVLKAGQDTTAFPSF